MIETIFMIEPWHWLVLGFVLMIVEMLIPTFASLWFGAAAIIVAALSWLLPISLLWQVLIWLGLSVVFMFAWFKYIKPLSTDRTKAGLGGSVIIGETGMVIVKPHDNQLGRVRFSVPIVGADEWLCRTRNESVEVGDRVVVVDISGNELIVAPTQQIGFSEGVRPTINGIQPSSDEKSQSLIDNIIPKNNANTSALSLDKPEFETVRPDSQRLRK